MFISMSVNTKDYLKITMHRIDKANFTFQNFQCQTARQVKFLCSRSHIMSLTILPIQN